VSTHATSPYLEPAMKPSQGLRVYRLLPLVLSLLLTLASCAPFPPPPPRPTATTFNCATALQCRVVVPRCGPAVTPDQSDGQGIWYAPEGNTPIVLPINAVSLVGFQLWLPTSIPDGASWYKAVLVQAGADREPNQPPLFHAAYGPWPPRIHYGAPLNAVLSIDETTGHLGPLSYLIGDNQAVQIQSQRVETMAGQLMTVYHLVYPPSFILHDTFLAIEVLWHAGPLTLRVLGIPGPPEAGLEEFGPNPRQGDIGGVVAWTGVAGATQTGDDDGVLLRLAASVVPYTDCG
jgi:hypothetical protein